MHKTKLIKGTRSIVRKKVPVFFGGGGGGGGGGVYPDNSKQLPLPIFNNRGFLRQMQKRSYICTVHMAFLMGLLVVVVVVL